MLTKTRARDLFYGGSVLFVIVFVASSTAGMPLGEEVIPGEHA